MTERLYHSNSFLLDFVAALLDVRMLPDGRSALVLDRTAFYPESGGQRFDQGWIELEALEGDASAKASAKLRVIEVQENEAGEVLHVLDAAPELTADVPTRVRGFIDFQRRRDHMQQHTGQHLLSAAFVQLFDAPTVSFHMGEQSCTIDLGKTVSGAEIQRAEALANQMIWEDRAVKTQLATADEARALGVRKLPEAAHEKLRLVSIDGFDLCACCGTHVRSAGQVGAILVRKTEKVKQGLRVEFVCGERAVTHARKDFETLTQAGTLFSAHIWELPAQIAKASEESRAAAKAQHKLLERIAELSAAGMLAQTPEANGIKLVVQIVGDGDLAYIKLLAQKLTAAGPNVIALLGTSSGQPSLVFARSPQAGAHNMGAIMKSVLASVGGRGGGSAEMAQGGVPDAAMLQSVIDQALEAIRQSREAHD